MAIRELVRHASASSVALLRFALTLAGLLLVMAVVRPQGSALAREDRWRVAALGFTGVAVYHLALNYGEHFVSANVASLIVASMPVMVAVLSRMFLKEDVNAAKWTGIVIALTGVVVLVLWGTPGGGLSVKNGLGAVVTALAPISWATYTIVSKPLVGRYGALRVTTWGIAAGTAMLVPVSLVPTLHDLGRLNATDWWWLVFLALACSVFAYLVWFYALGRLEPSEVAVWVYFVPLCAAGWGAVVLGERITPWVALGGAMVLAGVVVTERVAPRLARARAAERAVEAAELTR